MKTNEMQIFNYENNQVRTVMKDDDVWWVLKDVCEVLGLTNHKNVSARLDDDEKSKVHTMDLRNSTFEIPNRGLTIINESGLYSIIMLSRKPEAKKFKRWVTHEVLPSIRKHGAYITQDKIVEMLRKPETISTLLNELQKEQSKNDQLKTQIEHDKPKVLFADSVAASDDTILVREMAKILKGNGVNIGATRLYERLRQGGFLIKAHGCDYNSPTQRSMNMGLFRIKETVITHADGRTTISKTPKITGKGQQYFINYFLTNVNNETNEAGE